MTAATWQPDEATRARANLTALLEARGLERYEDLHAWSVEDRPGYWSAVLERLGVRFERPPETVLDASRGPLAPHWLPGARLDLVDSLLEGEPDAPAIVHGREGSGEVGLVTRGELLRRVDRFAAGLRARGLEPEDAVGLYLPMNVEGVVATLGILRAGCRAVSVAESFPAVELERRLAIGKARMLVTQTRTVRGGRELDLYSVVDAAHAPPAVVVAGPEEKEPSLRPEDVAWDEVLDAEGPPARAPGSPDRVMHVLFSSGTTAEPKAIPWTQLTPLKAAADACFHHDVHPEDRVAWPTSLGWMMGPWLIHATLLNGASMVLYEGAPTGRDYVEFLRRAGVTILGVVPSLVRAWRAGGVLEAGGLPGVRLFSSTGEPSDPDDQAWLMSTAGGAPVIEYCGGTELGGGYVTGTVLQPQTAGTFTTPALGLDLLLLDEDGQQVPDGEPGEVFLVPPSIGFSERLLNGDHDEVYHRGCPSGPGGEPLRRHGDRLVRLPGGGYRALGRADDTMNLGGVKVGSVELEECLAGHADVGECAAVAARVEGTERLVAYVVPEREGLDPARLREELGERLKRELNPLFRLHDVVLVDALPRTASNKLLRRKLRARYESNPI